MAATLTCGRAANEASSYLYVYESSALQSLSRYFDVIRRCISKEPKLLLAVQTVTKEPCENICTVHSWLLILIMSVKMSALLCVFLLYWTLLSLQAEKHSLYYIYTALSKPVNLPGIYQFTAMGLLDDRQIDYYNSEQQKKIPTQKWMKEKMQEDYWEEGTQSRKIKEQWFNLNLKNLTKLMNGSESDLHVLQWRTGCEVEEERSEVKFSKGISEFSYDGEDFLSFDDKESQWVASVDAALPTKRKWDSDPNLNKNTKSYLEKKCVDWIDRFSGYTDEKLRNGSLPNVQVFAKRSIRDKTKLNLTCMATGFYPKDVMLIIRKNLISLPEDEVESTGIRPNHDETFQLRKSVEINEDEPAEYGCFVSHRTLETPDIIKWDGKYFGHSLTDTALIAALKVIGIVGGAMLIVVLVVLFLKKKKIIDLKVISSTRRVL
uniref:Ig-like domain-containing protein n=1 Tax=Cyprinus carpio carpio TaxID=630221 RepID=A0A8C1BB67_CYPCA